MNFFLVEPNYFKFRLVVEADSPYDAVRRAVQWIRKEKGVYIMPHEFEVRRVAKPEKIRDGIKI